MGKTEKACVAEAIGTFALCFIGGGAICATSMAEDGGAGLLGIAIAHGLILSIAVSATMNVSGGHLNPAVTLAMLFTKRIDSPKASLYIVAQLFGAFAAGTILFVVFGGVPAASGGSAALAGGLGTPAYNPQMLFGTAVLVEIVLTFLLVFAIFGTVVDPRAPKIGGFGVGLTIAADILVGGPLTGAAMNPARTFGPGFMAWATNTLPAFEGQQISFWGQQLVYWAGPAIGAVLAAWVYDNLVLDKDATAA